MKPPGENAALSCALPCQIRTPRTAFALLRSGAFWVIGGRLAGIGLTLLANIVLARQLSPADYGKFNLLSSLIALFSLLTMFGLSGAVVRFIPEQLAYGREVQAKRILRLSYLTLGIVWALVAAVVWGGWPLFANEYHLPSTASFILLILGSAGLIALLQLTAESLRGFHELRFASLLSGGQTGGLLSNLLFVALLLGWGASATTSLEGALTLSVISLLVIAPLALALLKKIVGQHSVVDALSAGVNIDETPRLSRILAVCVPILLVQCVTLFSSQADIFIAGAYCEPDLGTYSAARRLMLLVAMPLQMANFLVISSIAAYKAKNQLSELQRLLQSVALAAAIPSLLALTLLSVGGGPILELLFGTAYRDAALPLAILACGQFVLAWAGSSHTTLLMTGHQNKALVINGVSALLLFGIGSWAADNYGILGLAVTSALIVMLENVVLVLLVRRLLGISAFVPFRLSKWAESLANLSAISRLTTRHPSGVNSAKGATHGE